MATAGNMADNAALLRTLRAATSSSEREKATSAVLDRLASTHSVPETQRLLDALWIGFPSEGFPSLLPQLKQVASVCSAPPRKAECVGHALVERLTAYVVSTSNHPEALRVAQEMLLSVFQANAAIVSGVLTAIESVSDKDATMVLAVTRPLLAAALIEAPPQRSVQKLALLQTLVRVAWSTSSEVVDLRTPIALILERAIQFSPLSTDANAWTVYPALVAAAVDLLVADSDPTSETVPVVAHAVLRRVGFGLTHDLGVVSLLHALRELATASPRLLCTSSLLFQLGVVLLHAQSAKREQTLVLSIVHVLLPAVLISKPRSIYVESLVLPLVAVQATHAHDATALLQRVLDTASSTPCERVGSNEPSVGVDAAHAASFLGLVASPDACERWLESLFHDKNPEIQDPTSTLLIQLGACLIDRRGQVRTLALDALARQLQLRRIHKNSDWTPSSIKLLVSTLVVLTSYRPASADVSDPSWLSQSFHVLASLAATTTETMKIILRLIKRMATATRGLRPQALTLMLLVWKQDARVYPQLEALLHQAKEDEDATEDDEAELVRMATILALCEKDPETGVEWIAEIQSFLESDCVSMVAMAVRAVALLCIADCLDYETTIKMFVVKLKKSKISCADDPRFQQELCQLYAIGGATGFVATSPKYSARVLEDLWVYAEAEYASVRVEAFIALNSYSLEALELRLSPREQADEDDEEDEDVLTEHDVEENVERVWAYMQTEEDDRVRVQLELLVMKILDAESHQLAPGGARRTGTGVASVAAFASSEQRVSAAATKELKKLFPTREALVVEQDNWCAYLLAYEPANVVESGAGAKRKDKRLRLVMGHVDEMQAVLDRCLKASSFTHTDSFASSSLLFLQLLQSVDAWNSFARKFFGRLEELSVLRTPMDAPVGHTAGVLSTLLDEHITRLVEHEASTLHSQQWLVIGALAYQACLSASAELLQDAIAKVRSLLRTRLLQSMEELRVYKVATHGVDVQHLLLGLLLAYPTELDPPLEAIVTRVFPLVVKTNEGSELMRAAAVLFVSHASALFRHDEMRAVQRQRLETGIEAAVTSLLMPMRGETAAAGIATKLLTAASPDVIEIAERAKKSSSATGSKVVAWAAAMGLAQLATRLASVHRLHWLDNLRLLLETVWQDDATLVGAIALGHVLLESVRHNRVSVAAVQEFTMTLQQRFDATSVVGVGVLVLPYVLQRVSSYTYVDSSRSDVATFLKSLDTGAESASSPILAVAAGNLLYGATGVSLLATTTTPEREIAVDDMAAIERLTAALATFKKQPQPALATCAAVTLAGIADRADAFVVVQKNKTFDVQITTLPATSLVFKTLAFLRNGNGDSDADSSMALSKRSSQSTLTCVAHASRSFPLPLDLSTLATRVTSRYAQADGVLAACIDLAASHASGVSLLMTNLLAPERLVNYLHRVVDACVDAVVTARGRLTLQQLTTLLSRVFDALVNCSRRDGACSVVSTTFAKWITLVGSLLEGAEPKEGEDVVEDAESVGPMVADLVVKDFLPRLPFTPAHKTSKALLGQFARDCLSACKDRNAVTEALLRVNTSAQPDENEDEWCWWRNGLLLSELLRLGSISSSSVVLRWLLQLDLSRVDNTSVLDAFTADIVEAVCVSVGKKAPIAVNEPWLLELLDGVARMQDTTQDAVRKRPVLFAAVQSVLSWTQLRGHESFLLRDAVVGRETMAQALPALVARALVLHHRESSSNAAVSLAQRLRTLDSHEQTVVWARDTIVRDLYVMGPEAPRSQLLSNDMETALVAQLTFL